MQEKEPPFEVALVRLCDDADAPGDWMADAAAKCAEARALWGECLAIGKWAGYPAQVLEVGAPSWHRTKWADRAMPVRAEKPSAAAKEAAHAMMQP
jgi:hypothetical protein